MNSRYDERQQWINNHLSRQTLFLVFGLLLFNAIFKSTGPGHWAEPMSELMIIIAVGSGFYVTRSLFKDAYLGKKDTIKKNMLGFGFIALLFLGIFGIGTIEPLSRDIIVNGQLSDDLVMLIGGIFFLYLFCLHVIKLLLVKSEH